MFQRSFIGILILAVYTSLFAGCTTSSTSPTAAASSGSIIQKSPNDDREYRAITLPNKLQAVLVSDPSIEVAAVSMAVAVGSYQDPEEQPGLAHYLEHMLFLGTEKYPEPNSFQKFVDENAGVWNAYTAVNHTNYFFQLNAEKLDPALDYFSDYFKKPTFDPQYSDKERNAVNSEWSMGRSQDGWIINRISGLTANPQHPAQRISVGNLETLSDKPGATLHEQLLAFYDRYYSANNMRLTIVGKQSLDELEALVKTHFATIPNKNISRPEVTIPGLTAAEKGKVIHYTSLREMRQLMIEFPLQDNSDQWRVKPNVFVNNLITSEEPGTVGEYLRRVGLVNMLYGYIAPDAYGSDGYLRVIAELTDKGLAERDHVIAAVFDYLELIKRAGVDEAYYRELKAMLQKDFENAAKPQPLQQAVTLSSTQLDYPVENLLNANYIYTHFDRDAINAVLRQLRPEYARIWHISNQEVTDTSIPFYEGSYSIRPIQPEELTRWQTLSEQLSFSLPPENPLFSEKPAAVVDLVYSEPELIVNQPGAEAWLAHAQHYREDKGYIELHVNVDFTHDNINNYILSALVSDAFSLQSTSLIDRATRAGIQIGVNLTAERSQMLSVSGYTAHHDDLMRELVNNFAQLHITDTEFAQVLDRFVQELANVSKQPPFRQAFMHYNRLVRDTAWTDEELLAAAKALTPADFARYHQKIMGDNLIRVYAFGNYQAPQIAAMTNNAAQVLNSKRLPEQRYLVKHITPKRGQHIVFNATTEQTDSAFVDGWIGTEQSIEQQAVFIVLNGLLGNELFTQLRTNEQMGYVVGSSPASFEEYPVYLMYVQSTNTDLPGISARLDKFRTEFYQQLQAVDPETLAQLKKSEIAQLTQKPANFHSEAQEHLWSFRWAKYDFDRKQKMVAALEKVSKEDLLNLYQKLLLNEAGARVTIQLNGTHFKDKPFATVKHGQGHDR